MITVVLLAVSAPLMRLLMPGAQADFVKESTDYFRMLLLSLPGLITMNALTGLLRASGESRIALLNSILINVVQIAAAYLFINRMGMKIMGAGCAYVACRYAGAIAMVIAVFGHHRGFRVEPPRIFRPSMPVVREILRVGLPTSVDSFSVQAGYLLNNSLLIGLGVRAASTYNVIATIVTFTGICQGIGNTSAATLVGQKVGAGDLPGARRRMNAILLYTFIATTVLCLVACLFPRFFAGLFSSDPDVISDSVRIMWLILPFCYVAVSVNVTEPGHPRRGRHEIRDAYLHRLRVADSPAADVAVLLPAEDGRGGRVAGQYGLPRRAHGLLPYARVRPEVGTEAALIPMICFAPPCCLPVPARSASIRGEILAPTNPIDIAPAPSNAGA